MSGKYVCSGERIPILQLDLAKKSCRRVTHKDRLSTPESIAHFVTKHYGCSPQEHFLTVLLNPRLDVIGVQEVALGALDQAMVDPRVVFAGAVTSGASAMVLVHNHPSGDYSPSQQDVQLTAQLVSGARLLGIKVLDHIVVGRGGKFTSMRQANTVQFSEAPSTEAEE